MFRRKLDYDPRKAERLEKVDMRDIEKIAELDRDYRNRYGYNLFASTERDSSTGKKCIVFYVKKEK